MGAGNWIKYGWGDKLNNIWNPGDKLVIDFTNNNAPVNTLPPLEAAIDAVNQIVATCPGPYTLMCSGGVDSQSMIWAWHKSGHPFNVVSIKYVSMGVWFNDHDLAALEEFTRKNHIPVTFYNLDIIDFLENGELHSMSVEYDCQSPQICTHIKMCELVPAGTILFSGNYAGDPVLGASLNYTILGLHRYAASLTYRSRVIIPFFFNYTPPIAYTVLANKILVRDRREIYAGYSFPIILPEKKFSGFEKVKDFYDSVPNRVPTALKIRYQHRPSHRIFDLLFRYALEDPHLSHNIAQVINKVSYNFTRSLR